MAALRFIQRSIGRHHGAVATLLGVTACVVAPTALRLVLSPLLGDVLWFSPYYPAVMIAGLWFGWRAGILVLLLSTLSVALLFTHPLGDPVDASQNLFAMLMFVMAAGVILATAGLLREALFRLARAAEQERALNHELHHRVKNLLAVTQGLARGTMRKGVDPEAFYADFSKRLAALARAHDVLSSGSWSECEFPQLPEAALEPFRGAGAIAIAGPPCSVPSEACVPLMLALHELATNAVKHGALSAPTGEVTLTWRIETQGMLRVEWVEMGGPPVAPPGRKGLGSKLLVRQSRLEAVEVVYDPSGVRCTIVVSGVSCADRHSESSARSRGLNFTVMGSAGVRSRVTP